jgi:hypothetical protein
MAARWYEIADRPLADIGGPSAHVCASTAKLLKNFDLRGSRHNGGHTSRLRLILLTILPQNIPCAMVLRLIRGLPGVPGLLATVPPGS